MKKERPKGTPIQKFWWNVDKRRDDECWPWKGHHNKKGYGIAVNQGQHWMAHRLAYHLLVGEFDLSLHVLHRCDNPNCVNPLHLFLGTNDDNVRDKVAKGRQCSHERHPKAKLTPQRVLEIRNSSLPAKELAAIYQVTDRTIYSIRNMETWI